MGWLTGMRLEFRSALPKQLLLEKQQAYLTNRVVAGP
jgi:hypothetical protein